MKTLHTLLGTSALILVTSGALAQTATAQDTDATAPAAQSQTAQGQTAQGQTGQNSSSSSAETQMTEDSISTSGETQSGGETTRGEASSTDGPQTKTLPEVKSATNNAEADSPVNCAAIADAISQTEDPEKHIRMLEDAGTAGDCSVQFEKLSSEQAADETMQDVKGDEDEDNIDDQPYVTAGEAEPLPEGATNDPRAKEGSGKVSDEIATAGAGETVTVTVRDLEGMEVFANGESVGEVEDILADATGRPISAVIEVGGFLGIGEREVALPLSDLKYDSENKRLITDHSVKALKELPELDS
ncbi:PRC-barrel domain-containing protein [Sagittula salina]|uniref:PRC-barrel domain-containing protein n=1 Tax=Sagittula salina TaxID=2820268 RepID=A0A940MLM7_9RHOB|nr:PRC-barrel domain-containing protein [Sagittula salina]MBP0481629.1 PRC-barrel domain-containing protein [Sagittula salina]